MESSSWICSNCSFENTDNSGSVCSMCYELEESRLLNTPGKIEIVIPIPSGDPNPVFVLEEGQWICSHCTFVNDDRNSNCMMCMMNRV